MGKPRILVLDYNKSRYAEIEDIVCIEMRTETPKDVDGFSGVVIHNPSAPGCYGELIDRVVKEKMPLILHGCCSGAFREGLDDRYGGYDKAYHISANEDLVEKIREIFSS